MRHPGPGQGEGDLYGILGVSSDAPREEIVRAYHRAAHAAHPDRQPGDPDAGARFRALTEAYDVLSDPDRRARYDRISARPDQPAARHPPAADPAGGPYPGFPPARRPGHVPARAMPPGGAPIYAGPVHVEPPPGPLADGPPAEPGMPAELVLLLYRYLGRDWGWPR